MTPGEWMQSLIQNAERLREVGVLELSAGDCAAKLAPAQIVGGKDSLEEQDEDIDPLDDPDTYGGVVPGLRTDRLRKEDE